MDEIKKRYEVSEDELSHRMEIMQKVRVDPVTKAVAILELAIDSVLESLGINVQDADSIHNQMIERGIVMIENTDERTPQLNGFFIFVPRGGEPVPYAWVGSASLNADGRCFCQVQYFMDERLVSVGGAKLVGG